MILSFCSGFKKYMFDWWNSELEHLIKSEYEEFQKELKDSKQKLMELIKTKTENTILNDLLKKEINQISKKTKHLKNNIMRYETEYNVLSIQQFYIFLLI